MEKLEPLDSVTRISSRVVRILGQNPGKFTLQGTNTYIIGTSNPYLLVDTGEGNPEYPPLLRTVLESPKYPSLPDISDIILTHRHHDHVRGLPSVLTLCRQLWAKRNPETPFVPPRIHKFPLSAPNADPVLSELVSDLQGGNYVPTPERNHFHDLADGQTLTPSALPPGADSTDWTLRVLYCPGHTVDSISLLFPADRALFTGDTVLGQGTAVFEDLYEYTILMYIDHRLERESQIVEVLRMSPPEGSWTIWAIVSKLYEGYPESLLGAAARGVQLHLKKLEREGRIKFLGGELRGARWELIH
ncbi:Metallo-hydrolase/oxidoreductase [Lactifluus volemus]|nr:Metallo-hydrolase/oxidoreductase [Lactifluus volemus]